MRDRLRAPRIETKSGFVEGFILQTKNASFNVFLGIPYAEPPIGELRFKKTVPITPWNGVKKCKKYKSRAPQLDFFWDRLELRVGQNEDCLYLNVIAPNCKSTTEVKGFPVMFYIHGGGFVVDSAVRYSYRKMAKLISSHEVIVVTIQYRLGFLGFFTTGDDNCLGNFGIWDQVTALQWVANNIEYFGGNPKRITVVGQSAGAVSADLLTLSPYSRHLIIQAVLLGGNAECTWAISNIQRISEYCKKHAQKLGWQGMDSGKMLEYLRTKPAKALADGMIGNQALFRTGRLPLTPVIDGDLLPRSIAELRSESPIIRSLIGVTEDEGLLFVAVGRMACNQKDIDRAIGMIAEAVEGTDIDAHDVVHKVYMKSLQANDGSRARAAVIRRAFVDILGDLTSNYGTSMYMEKQVNKGAAVYAYSLEHCNPACYGLLNTYLPYRIEWISLNPGGGKPTDENFSDPNGITVNDQHNPETRWEPATLGAYERHIRIAGTIEMREVFKNGRITELRNIFRDVPLLL